VLVTLVRAEQDCFKELFVAVNITRRISEFIWQWVPDRRTSDRKSPGRPYVLSRQRGTMSRCRLAERSRCRDATSMAGATWSARYRGACPCIAVRGSLYAPPVGTSWVYAPAANAFYACWARKSHHFWLFYAMLPRSSWWGGADGSNWTPVGCGPVKYFVMWCNLCCLMCRMIQSCSIICSFCNLCL